MTLLSATGADSRRRVRVLGLPVDAVDLDGALERMRGFLDGQRTALVITADSSGMVQAQTDAVLRELYETADLVTADSAGVVWAANRAGAGLKQRVSGVEMADRLCALSAERGTRLFFLGAEPGVAELAAERMRLKHPGCNIVGTRHGYFPQDDDAVVAAEVAAARPEVLLVAMGIPRQEKFIRATESLIGAKLAMGVGGTFDVFSGKTKRAPRLFQALKLEWLWRVLLNPSKIHKVALLPKFVGMVLRSR